MKKKPYDAFALIIIIILLAKVVYNTYKNGGV